MTRTILLSRAAWTPVLLLVSLGWLGCQVPGTSVDTERPPEAASAASASGKDNPNGTSPKKPLYSPGHHHH